MSKSRSFTGRCSSSFEGDTFPGWEGCITWACGSGRSGEAGEVGEECGGAGSGGRVMKEVVAFSESWLYNGATLIRLPDDFLFFCLR